MVKWYVVIGIAQSYQPENHVNIGGVCKTLNYVQWQTFLMFSATVRNILSLYMMWCYYIKATPLSSLVQNVDIGH